MRKLLSACAPFCLLLPQAAMSQDIVQLEEIVTSATIEPQALNRTGATVDVIDEDDLSRAPLSVADGLDRAVGTSVSANGGLGSSTTLRVRGLDGKYLGVRIDGIDVADPSGTQTQFNFGGLTSANVGRVELVRGSQSALYGSEAVAGVVDITTRELSEDGQETRLSLEAGSFGTVNASIGHAVRRGNTALSFNLSQTHSDGFSARAGDEEADGFSQSFLTVKGETEIMEGVIIGASTLYRDGTVEYDQSDTDPRGDNPKLERGARLFTLFDAFGVEHEFSYSLFDVERRDPVGFVNTFDGDREQISYRGTTYTNFGALSFGLDQTTESFATDFDGGESKTQSALAELLTDPSDTLALAFSLRYDNSDEFGASFSGRAALAWQATPDTTIRAVAGNGFRAPSLFERFSDFGDPALREEKSRSFEFGVEQRWADSQIEATVFYTEIDDLINFDGAATGCVSTFGCYTQVPGTTVSQGIEIAGKTAINDRLTISANYTYTDAEIDGVRLVRVPRHDLFLGVDARITERLSGTASIVHLADIEASAFAPAGNKVGDHTLFGLGVNYDVNDQTEVYLRVENLFDEDYETAGGFNTAGRSVFAGIRASF